MNLLPVVQSMAISDHRAGSITLAWNNRQTRKQKRLPLQPAQGHPVHRATTPKL